MIGGNFLLREIEQHFAGTTRHFAFPFLRVRIPSARFVDLTEEEREEIVATTLKMDVAALRDTSNRLFLRLDFVAIGTDEYADETPRRGETWLGLLGRAHASAADVQPMVPPVVHFYGFKGGQGRTTLLAFLANDLARDGLRVLVVDLDAEAPSLDLVFGVQEVPPEASLVGLRAGLAVQPISVAAPAGGGSVALLAFRPSAEDFDLDAAALSFEAGVFSPSHEELGLKIKRDLAKAYDVLLMDHRTGLAPTVPAWIRTMTGPVVMLDRLDGQSRRARSIVEALWKTSSNPGLLVSYVPPSESLEAFRERGRGEAWGWLDALARAKSQAFTKDQEPLGPEDIEDHWVLWPDDNAFRRRGLPQRDEVGGRARECVQRLRDVLELPEGRAQPLRKLELHPSGATDEGSLIATEALRRLCAPGSPIRFVFGRKGTGKTRLLRVLAERRIGEPLVVADDERAIGGLPSGSLIAKDLVRSAIDKQAYEGLWFTVLAVAIENGSTDTARMTSSLEPTPTLEHGVTRIRAALRDNTRPHVYLVDGLETMFDQAHAKSLIEALFRVASTLEHDQLFRSRVSLRIFLRTDIAAWGFQNFEQQTHGKRLDLQWSTQGILNFVLSRIPHLEWIRSTFPEVVVDIQALDARISDGEVPEEDCLRLLLRIFPTKLGRLNLNMATFLRTYFSDDPQGRESYYPRVYDTFLGIIDRAGLAGATLVSGRVDQAVIVQAHDEASKAFLQQIRQELQYLTPLDDSSLNRLLNALNGERTPFDPKELGRHLRITLGLRKTPVDDALKAMESIGIFETHPSLPSYWRVGRLFKSALGMIYNRGG